RPFGRKRLLGASHDHGEWTGTGESDTIAETSVDAGMPAGMATGLATELTAALHDDGDFTDEDTFTDRDTTEADATELGSELPGRSPGRDTMLELTPRDTLLDLSAAARAASGAEPLSGDRTLED